MVAVRSDTPLPIVGVGAGGQVKYRTSKQTGAMLKLDFPGQLTRFKMPKGGPQYIVRNYERWTEFAGTYEGGELPEKTMFIFVNGVTKTAAGHCVAMSSNGGSDITVEFDASAGQFVTVSGGGSVSHSRETSTSPSQRSFPYERPRLWTPKFEHSIFLNYYKMVKRLWWMEAILAEAEAKDESPPPPDEDEMSEMSYSASSSKSDQMSFYGMLGVS